MSTGFYSNSAQPPPPPPPGGSPYYGGGGGGGGASGSSHNNYAQRPHSGPYGSNGGLSGGDGGGANGWFTSDVGGGGKTPAGGGGAKATATARSRSSHSNESLEAQHRPSAPVVDDHGGGVPAPSLFNPGDLSGPMNSAGVPSAYGSTTSIDDFADEPPLMEELGVHVPNILLKSRSVLLPFSSRYLPNVPVAGDASAVMDNDDLVGPIAFALLLGSELLLAGKIHFGYIYGFSLFGSVAMASLLYLMKATSPSPSSSDPAAAAAAAARPATPGGGEGTVSLWSVVSILGYSLLPVNALAFVNVFVRLKNYVAGAGLGVLTVLWCTVASTRLFERGCDMRDQRYLVAYPTALFFSCFVIITIY